MMEYQEMINLLNNKPIQPSKFKTEHQVETNNKSQRAHNEDNQIRFKTPMLRLSLCDYSDAYQFRKGY